VKENEKKKNLLLGKVCGFDGRVEVKGMRGGEKVKMEFVSLERNWGTNHFERKN